MIIITSMQCSYVHVILQDRWLECDLEKNQFPDGFVGFGGGRYQCPGKSVWTILCFFNSHTYLSVC